MRGVRGWYGIVLAVGLVAGVLIAPAAWSSVEAPVVAVLDSGIDMGHPEFGEGQLVGWRDFVEGEESPYDDLGHGTAVASRVGGMTLGADPGVKLLVGKVLNGANSATWADVVKGIDWSVEQGADVINVSIWSFLPAPYPTTVDRAIERATDAGVLVVWIAGNGGGLFGVPTPVPSVLLMGAGAVDALVVGASDSNGRPADFSQWEPEVLAEGEYVEVAVPGGGTSRWSGTSFAAPWIAGAAARLLADGAPRDPAWLEWVILHAAHDGPEHYAREGYGFVGPDQLEQARAVARGDEPFPARDGRDDLHEVMDAARMARSGRVPQ